MKTRVRQQLIFWIGFLVWDILQSVMSLALSNSKEKNMLSIGCWSGVLDMVCKILLFYGLYYFAYRPAMKRSGIDTRIVLVTTLLLTVGLLLQRAMMVWVMMPYVWGVPTTEVRYFRFYSLVVTFFDMLVPVCLLFIYELYMDSRENREQQAQLEKDKLSSELRYLKAQINPHFLFNVLGTIHALSHQKAPEAADVTVRLSKIMRFMLYEAGNSRVTLAAELKILDDYIALEHVRFSNKLAVDFIKEVPDESLTIAPLLLLPFVENAFKHGAAESKQGASIRINLRVTGHCLIFEVHNTIEPGETGQTKKGIGLANTRRQLDLIYPGYQLDITSTNNCFSVFLKLQLEQQEKNDLPGN